MKYENFSKMRCWILAAVTLILPQLHFGLASGSIKGPPRAERKMLTRVARIGEDVKLNCPMSGSPLIDWSKENEEINFYSRDRFKTSRKSLKIQQIIKDDTGNYVCKGTNGFGTEEIHIKLVVLDPEEYPELFNEDTANFMGPSWSELTDNLRSSQRKNAGDTIRLTCEAFGYPDPEVRWARVDKIDHDIEQITKRSRINKSSLVIRDILVSDSGIYTCSAQSILGIITKNFTLIVEDVDRPVMPRGPQNTTVITGNPAHLEGQVQSKTTPNVIKWLKKVELWEANRNSDSDIRDVGQHKFRVIQQVLKNLNDCFFQYIFEQIFASF